MLESTKELLADIDATLSQLLQNAEALKNAESHHAFIHEVEALKKTQESLLARLIHRQSILDTDKKKKVLESIRQEALHQKMVEFAYGEIKKPLQKWARSRKARSKSRG